MRDLFLLLFGIILFFLPLSSNLSGIGNDWTIVLAIVLAVFYFSILFFSKIHLSKRDLQVSIIFSLVFIYVLLTRAINTISTTQILHWLVIIWIIPFIDYLRHNYPKQIIIFLMLGILVLHAQWAIAQFVVQHDLGLSPLGESRLSVTTPGVAKFSFQDIKLIRAYGPYPHSNSLAGSLAIGLAVLLYFSPFRRGSTLGLAKGVGVFIIFLALLISFSRSAYLSIAIALLVMIAQKKWSVLNKHLLIPSLIILTLLSPLIYARFTDREDQAVPDRVIGLSWYREVISTLPVWQGLGPGNYQQALQNYMASQNIPAEPWQIAPVHNALLLFLAEWGVLATGIISILCILLLRHHSLIILPLLPLLLTDHYLVTQTAPLVWAMLAVAVVE